ncbi:MAG: phosphotransferase [Spirochaetes bacterium]|nr:phosphotransferase [Spirochaetota bacterium]
MKNNKMFKNETINLFLEKFSGSSFEASELKGDASSREYYRIISGKKSYILCIDENFKGVPPEEYAFCIIHDLFKNNKIPVPEIYCTDEEAGLLLIQDLGDVLLEQNYIKMSRGEAATLYSELINIIAQIQFINNNRKDIPFSLAFDIDKLMYEFNFFIDHALIGYFKADISNDLLEELREEFRKIAVILYKPELFVLNHRDFHSRNVLISRNEPSLIDFQDARMGLPHYDMVSLLRDSYLQLEDNLVKKLKKDHYNILKAGGYSRMEFDEYEYYFDIMAFQRNIKAIGTFGYQITSLGKDLYRKYIIPTVSYLNGYIRKRNELAAAAGIIKRFIEVDF